MTIEREDIPVKRHLSHEKLTHNPNNLSIESGDKKAFDTAKTGGSLNSLEHDPNNLLCESRLTKRSLVSAASSSGNNINDMLNKIQNLIEDKNNKLAVQMCCATAANDTAGTS